MINNVSASVSMNVARKYQRIIEGLVRQRNAKIFSIIAEAKYFSYLCSLFLCLKIEKIFILMLQRPVLEFLFDD